MFKNKDGKEIPEVVFTLVEDGMSEEERQERIKELLKERNEFLASLEVSFSSENEIEADEKSNADSDETESREVKPQERMKAGILGFAVGDALGVPVEFLDRDSLQRRPLKEMIGYGSYRVPEGTWSDDTSLMLAAMDSIREKGIVDFDDIMYKFTEWVDTAKYTATDELFDIGMATSKAILNFKRGEKATNCGVRGMNENGNGSLMRILPFVYYLKFSDFSEEEKTIFINQASALTHAHEISQLGCKIYSDYVTLLLDGVDKVNALELLKEIDYGKYYSDESIRVYERILKGDLKSLMMRHISSSGYVVDTLEASLWCTVKNDTYEDAVVEAVNLGGDTDTIAAVTGSLSAIIYGEHSIPERWLNKLRKKDYLEEISNQFISTISSEKKSKSL